MEEELSGVLVVNKEKGMTSFDVVREVGKILHTKKIGHTGTLDPLAEGVLILCIGQATKIVELLTAYDKEYVAGARLGITTDSYDILGKVLSQVDDLGMLSLPEVIHSYQRTYLQEVPIFSAIKVHGKKLYEYARKGEKVDLPRKKITIKEIELLKWEGKNFLFRAHVSKGCYIRSLINDIGKDLGVGACMTSLVRTKQGSISIDSAVTIKDIQEGNYRLLKIEDVLPIPKIMVDNSLEFKIKNGVKVPNSWNIEDKVLFISSTGKLLGIYEREQDTLKVWKNFY